MCCTLNMRATSAVQQPHNQLATKPHPCDHYCGLIMCKYGHIDVVTRKKSVQSWKSCGRATRGFNSVKVTKIFQVCSTISNSARLSRPSLFKCIEGETSTKQPPIPLQPALVHYEGTT